MNRENLAEQAYWDASYKDLALAVSPKNDPVRRWILQNVPRTTSGTCLEIGAYPGRYLPIFGELGYRLSGVDLTPGTIDKLPYFLQTLGFLTGPFYQADATTLRLSEQFDVVCSFGFVEHFENFPDIIRQHIALVKPGGLLVITAPNFLGRIQHRLHRMLDAENLQRHNIRAMDIRVWTEIVKQAGCTPIESDYFGKFDFWADVSPKKLSHRLVSSIVARIKPVARLLPNHRAWSAYAGLIARRNS